MFVTVFCHYHGDELLAIYTNWVERSKSMVADHVQMGVNHVMKTEIA